MTPSPHHLAHMTTLEAADAAASGSVLLIPAGAFEQHGPGLPLATDQIRADGVCGRLAHAMGGRAIVGPPIPVGVSPHHLRFSGTVSLSTTTFAAVVREYVRSLHGHGWNRILVVTGHGGNGATLTTVAQDLMASTPALQFAWTPLTALAKEAVAALHPTKISGHSGEGETAQMLALAPGLVRTHALQPGTTELGQLDALSRVARSHAQPTMTRRFDQLSANGVLGDPRKATPEAGEAIIQQILDRLTTFIDDWLATS